MKKWLLIVSRYLFALMLGWGLSAAQAQPTTLGETSGNLPLLVPAAPDLNAKAYVLMDANSGKILAERNMDTRRPPASLTKLMTLYLTANAIKNGQINLDDKVKVSRDAWQTGGSRMFVKVGSLVPVHNLIEGVIVASGNDACMALAQYVGGNVKTFVRMMNDAAKFLGMSNTHYTDPTGLPAPDHYSSAHDLAKLARAIILSFPNDYHAWFSQKWIVWNHIRQPNRNRLLWRDQSVDGLKTGHTKAAGYCLIASAMRHGMRLIAVVMGTPSDEARNDDADALLNYGFRFYNTVKIFDAQQVVTSQRVWLGTKDKVGLGLPDPLYVTVAKGLGAKLKTQIKIDQLLKAPVVQGQPYGTLNVMLDGKLVSSQKLLALSSDEVAGFWSRLVDHIGLFFHRIGNKI